ncbi:MAG: DUF1080 domain-containing protein, partial [Planctomycetes bacterium]|nr:DUF1080 domain-containing protein [Planctomycetota bacterium]
MLKSITKNSLVRSVWRLSRSTLMMQGTITYLLVFVVVPWGWAAERTDWLSRAGWGVMTHYLAAPPSSAGGKEVTAEMWNRQVDAFDVELFANQVAATGARYVLFTIGQNSGHYCAPNATYDKFVGIRPSKCSRRDLIADLAKALKNRDIRLMVYLPSGAPAADRVARRKLGWRWGRKGGWQLPGEPVGGRLADFQRRWEAVVREWSLRWGDAVAGWWIDGCYFADQMYRFDDPPNFASFAAALRAGNPDAIIAFNPGVRVPVIAHTKYEDYTAGEVNLPQLPQAVAACPGRWIERDGAKIQFHILTFLGKSWCRGDRPQWPDDKIVALTRQLIRKGGAITFDVPIRPDGEIPEPFLWQLQAVGRAIPQTIVPRKEIRFFEQNKTVGLYTWMERFRYRVPPGTFTMANGVLHFNGEGNGYLCTTKHFRDYHLVVEYRWGEHTSGDRKTMARSSGVFLHGRSPDGAYEGKFMAGLECQIIEGGTGDFELLPGKNPDGTEIPRSVEITVETADHRDYAGQPVWKKGGKRVTLADRRGYRVSWFNHDPDWKNITGYKPKSDLASPGKQWTRLDIICDADRVQYYVNGVLANEAFNVR